MSGPGTVSAGPPRSVRISGWGSYVPERVLSNADLERIVDTSDEWIRTRTGISERRVAAPHETTATLGAIAAKRALAVAGLLAHGETIVEGVECIDDSFPGFIELLQKIAGEGVLSVVEEGTG